MVVCSTMGVAHLKDLKTFDSKENIQAVAPSISPPEV
jgi:hypothetical protein